MARRMIATLILWAVCGLFGGCMCSGTHSVTKMDREINWSVYDIPVSDEYHDSRRFYDHHLGSIAYADYDAPADSDNGRRWQKIEAYVANRYNVYKDSPVRGYDSLLQPGLVFPDSVVNQTFKLQYENSFWGPPAYFIINRDGPNERWHLKIWWGDAILVSEK